MATITKHLPAKGEVRVKVISGQRGVMKVGATFGMLRAVKLDGGNEWRWFQRNEVSLKEV